MNGWMSSTGARALSGSLPDRCGRAWRAVLAIASVAVLTGLPKLAQACAVCSAGRDDATRGAFISTTVLLSALPLFMVGGISWWLRSRTRAQAREVAPTGHGHRLETPGPLGALQA
jgi:hypothetical protein